jgi:hypothetical protein
MARISFNFHGDKLQRNVVNIPKNLNNSINAVMDRTATMGEANLKTNAPWHDRTGNARNGLHTAANLANPAHKEIVFAHSVEYGIWLETIESGQWAVILKTMRISGYEMMEQLRFLLNRTKF